MEIQTLRYFLEVAKAGNMTRAAEILHVSQPLLSKCVKELEDELGTQLFIRKSRGIVLTEAGLLLRQRADEIVALAEKTKSEFRALDDLIGGDIHIGCAEADGFKYFVRLICDLQKKYPRVVYHLYSGDSELTTYKLDRGLLDFVILSHANIDLKKYNRVTLPAKNRWGVIMRKDSVLAEKSEITRADIVDIPIICSRQGLDEELFDWIGETKLNIVATCDLIFNASIMVREGFGCLLGYDKIINTDNNELCFRPLSPAQESPMHIIWKKHQTFTPVAKVLLKSLNAVKN